MRCLIIDDNPDDRALVERVVSSRGHRTASVGGGRDALALLNEHRFDVALVDLRMQDMSGVETLRELRKADKDLRLLVVTGCADQKHILSAIMTGADGYILKHDLGQEIQRALDEVRVGKSPLSGQVAATVLHEVKRLGSEPPERNKTPPFILGRIPPSKPRNDD